MKRFFLLLFFTASLLASSDFNESEINTDNLFVLAPGVSIYSLLVNPEKYENKVVTFSGFWKGVPWESDGMIYPNRDLVNFNDNFAGINIYLKKSVEVNLSFECDKEYFAVQGKVKKARDVFIIIEAVVRRVPSQSLNKCSLGND